MKLQMQTLNVPNVSLWQESANHELWLEFCWKIAPRICLQIVSGCFCISAAEPSNCERDDMAHKAENIFHLILDRKNWSTFALLLSLLASLLKTKQKTTKTKAKTKKPHLFP